ncbi:ABC transporter substrate-binding protein [Oribacterium sp. oral taxon 078]|uniref:ABC transporter substrate-binding protein n=1 Tax=Oribacterium sp. oral taxon 078 TaxID=652706 RepID=UPI0005633C9C
MKKRQLGAAALAVLTGLALASCGGGGSTESASTEKAAEKQADASEAKSDSSSEDGKGLVYWSMWEATEPQGKVIREAAEKFSKDTGIPLDVQFKGRTGIREGLQPALDAGSRIDLFDEDIDRVNKTWGDYILDLEELSKSHDYEKSANAGLIAACREVGGGKLKSIPYQPNVFAFFYNQSLFDEAGISEVPKTWEELGEDCQKLKDKGYVPITSDDAYILSMFGYHLSRINGYEKASEIVKNGKWDDPSVLEVAKAYEDFAKKGYFSENISSNVWPAGQNQELALGSAAIYLNGSWLPNEVKDMTGDDFKWGCFSYPAVPGGKDGTEASNYGAQVFAISKDSKNPEAAFRFIEYVTKGEFDKKLSEESLGIPADSENSDWPEQLAAVKPVMDSLKTRYPWAASAEDNVDMTPILKENMQKLCGGEISAEDFVKNLQK